MAHNVTHALNLILNATMAYDALPTARHVALDLSTLAQTWGQPLHSSLGYTDTRCCDLSWDLPLSRLSRNQWCGLQPLQNHAYFWLPWLAVLHE